MSTVLIEHLFRRQAGRIMAHLTRLLGAAHLDVAEEAVQEAMLRAVRLWPQDGVPEQPEAWLYRVAHNAAIDALRRRRFTSALEDHPGPEFHADRPDLEEQIRDDELRMVFMCCHPEISREAAVVLSLKTVGGLSVREIARALLAEDEAIAQRLVRAKRQIRDRGLTLDLPAGSDLQRRLDAVLEVIYLIYNEGYAAHEGDALVRQDLCREALRLGSLVASSSLAEPRAHALQALMAFQSARLQARVDELGEVIPLEEQNRELWDQQLVAVGFRHFDLSIEGEEISEYHSQAAIAATYARAAHGPVPWRVILDLYDDLMERHPSPIVALNRAVVLSKVDGPVAALAEIEGIQIKRYYLLLAVRGHLLLELNRPAEAAAAFRAALDCRCSEPERRFLKRKLDQCGSAT